MTSIRATDLDAFAHNAPLEMARFCIDNLTRMAPAEALAALETAREALSHGHSQPTDPALSVRVELSRALYSEFHSRHLDAAASYELLLSWLHERGGPVSSAHVDGLLAALSWAVLNEQHEWTGRLIPHIEAAVASSDAPEAERRVWTESLQFWLAQAQTSPASEASREPHPRRSARPRSLRVEGKASARVTQVRDALLGEGFVEGEHLVDCRLIGPEENRPAGPGLVVRVLDSAEPRAMQEGAPHSDILHLPREGLARLVAEMDLIAQPRASSQIDYARLGRLRERYDYDESAIEACFGYVSQWVRGLLNDSSPAPLRACAAVCLAVGYLAPFAEAREMYEAHVPREPACLQLTLESTHYLARRQFLERGVSPISRRAHGVGRG